MGGEVDVIADQHGGPGRPCGVQSAASVRQDHDLGSGRGGRAHAVGHGPHTLALVEVGARPDHQGVIPVREPDGTQGAAVALQGGGGEAGDLGRGDLVFGLTDEVRGTAPPGAQGQGDPVPLHAGALTQDVRGAAGEVEGIRASRCVLSHGHHSKPRSTART